MGKVNLNPEQSAAVNHGKGPILILAGAGTGKTRVLTHRVANLISNTGVRADEILAVTFTNKAAGEMRERLKDLLGAKADRLWISTFHSAALRILRRHAKCLGYKNDFVVYDTKDSTAVLKAIIKKMGIDSKQFKPGFYLSRIDNLKNNFISPEEFAPEPHERSSCLQAVYSEYQKELILANAMDFTDLILNCLRLLKSEPDILKLYQRTLKYVLATSFKILTLCNMRLYNY